MRRIIFERFGWLIPAYVMGLAHFFYKNRYWPALRSPRTFNERVTAYKLKRRDALLAYTADKYLVRDYVRSRVGDRYLSKIIRNWNHPDEVEVSGIELPFILKGSHGCGFNLPIQSEGDIEEVQPSVYRWHNTNYYWYRREWAYRYLKPRFFAEEWLGKGGTPPTDYKFFVCGGRVRAVQVDLERTGRHRRALMTPDWQMLDMIYVYPRPATAPEKPERLDEMMEIAEALGEEFEFVRVDLYDLGDRVVFGELTHYPQSGTGPFGSKDQDLRFGRLVFEGDQ